MTPLFKRYDFEKWDITEVHSLLARRDGESHSQPKISGRDQQARR